jgi:hypothetical protein
MTCGGQISCEGRERVDAGQGLDYSRWHEVCNDFVPLYSTTILGTYRIHSPQDVHIPSFTILTHSFAFPESVCQTLSGILLHLAWHGHRFLVEPDRIHT